MLGKLVSRLKSFFRADQVILPHMGRPSPEKVGTVRIVQVDKPDDVNGLRDPVKGDLVLFLDV
jgi:hypothetical protein